MSEGFTKLFASITDSTVWAEPDTTRIVWVTMLAMADETGYVGASVVGLAHRARVSQEACEMALARFLSPDPGSRNPANDGRRIELAERGWSLLNYGYFRAKRDQLERRYVNRERMRAIRAAAKARRAEQKPVHEPCKMLPE